MKKMTRRSALQVGGGGLVALLAPKISPAWLKEDNLRDCAGALDHLLVGTPDLDHGIEWFERLTGVRPAVGGSHPGRGTRNALVSLGGRHYLEVIAPDPGQPEVSDERVTSLKSLPGPQAVQWAAASADMAATKKIVEASGIRFTGPTPGSRQRPDGRLLRWSTLNLEDTSLLLPFFIHWEPDSLHPSQDSPSGCKLVGLRFESPHPEESAAEFAKIGLRAEVRTGKRAQIFATLMTPRGRVEIGPGGRVLQ